MESEERIISCPLINIDDYDILDDIFKGPYDQIYMAKEKKTGKNVAIKSISLSTKLENDEERLNRTIIREVNTSSVKVPGIVHTIGYRFPLKEQKIKNTNQKFAGYIIVSEFMENGCLSELIKDYLNSNGQNSKINPTIRSKIIFGVASTMKQLHKLNIIHRDLKINNILLDEKMEPRITDFGLSKFIVNPLDMTMNVGTPICMAPELFSDGDETYGLPVDVYAYSFILYFMFSNQITFDDNRPLRSPQQFMMKIGRGARPKRPDNIPDHYWDLINKCWKQNPNERPTFEEITEMLKDDKFALHEFGMDTNIHELHEYQERIDSN